MYNVLIQLSYLIHLIQTIYNGENCTLFKEEWGIYGLYEQYNTLLNIL